MNSKNSCISTLKHVKILMTRRLSYITAYNSKTGFLKNGLTLIENPDRPADKPLKIAFRI